MRHCGYCEEGNSRTVDAESSVAKMSIWCEGRTAGPGPRTVGSCMEYVGVKIGQVSEGLGGEYLTGSLWRRVRLGVICSQALEHKLKDVPLGVAES